MNICLQHVTPHGVLFLTIVPQKERRDGGRSAIGLSVYAGPDKYLELITEAELHEIRRIWRKERQDWEDSVPLIYAEMTGETLDWLAG